MPVTVHTMEYCGNKLSFGLSLRCYEDRDYAWYKCIYDACFRPMRAALKRFPLDCCAGRDELLQKREHIFMMEDAKELVGSVAVYENEIDDLIVAESFRRRGYGTALLRFAVSRMQLLGTSPILLHVADWNQNALQLYLKNGFQIVKTEELE